MLLAVLLALPLWTGTQTAEAEPAELSVVLRNVTLTDPEAQAPDVLINLVIENGSLELVSQDNPARADDYELDAGGAFLLGRLQTGQPPSFLLLNEDPRENFSVLLDTASHAVFAINDGVIEKNELGIPALPAQEPSAARTGWLAYTPPPMALPTSYQDSSKWNRWESRYVSGIFLGAAVLDRQKWLSQDAASLSQGVGDLAAFDGGEVRGLRFGTIGTLNFPTPWVYTIFAATNAFDKGFDTDDTDDFALFDLRLDIPLFGSTLSVGKQKEPISLERTMGLIYLPFQERSAAADALLPARNTGLVLSGTASRERVSWAAGYFNDWLDSDTDFADGANQLVGRLTWLAAATADESNLLHLGAGIRFSDANEGLVFATEPEFNQAPLYVDTGPFDAEDSLTWVVEASWRRGPFWLAGEYLRTEVNAPLIGDPRFDGYQLTASWALTGEMRAYQRKNGTFSPLPVARSVYNNGPGAWEIAARWSVLDTNTGVIDGGESDVFSLGLNWWLSPILGVSANYRWITLDRDGLIGKSDGFNTRIVLMLE
jgi:phosphate-selective porin OprO/OprP